MTSAIPLTAMTWGSPACGGPLSLQLAANVSDSNVVEQGLEALLAPHRGLFLGPMMIGFMTDMVLCGVMVKQLLTWFSFALEDRWFIKTIVTWCAISGAIGSVFNLAFVHQTFVYHFGHYTELADSSWSSWLGIIAPLTSAGVQMFYCDRAYRLSGKNKLLGLTILGFILTSLGGGIGSKVTSTSLADASAATKATICIYLYTAGAMAADFTITVSIMWCLAHSKTGFDQTDQVVNQLLRISAETQLPPTLMAISFLIIFAYKTTKAAAHPEQLSIDITSNLTGFFMMVMPKTYVVGFLAVLNSRTSLRAVLSSSEQTPSHPWKNNAYQLRSRSESGNVPIKVTTETYVQADRYDPSSNVLSRHEYTPQTHVHVESMKNGRAITKTFDTGAHGDVELGVGVEHDAETNKDKDKDKDMDFDMDLDDDDDDLDYGRPSRKRGELTWADALRQ